ncbi:MAG TPA: hypothetical protein VLQ93_14010 [Myxococcaceae bacterium]|nr:hypothetical protein [Myxococcaceae bacterium]
MSEPSSERLKSAVQALFQTRPVEGPPGDDGQRSVWHLSTQGAELLSFVDDEGQVQRQELTLLDEHCVWTSGVGLRTGRVEQDAAVAGAKSSIVHPDSQPLPARLLRAALALESYSGEDPYILHIQRVLALARQGLVLSGGASASPAGPPDASPGTPPPSSTASSGGPPAVDPLMLRRQRTEGWTMVIVLTLGLVLGIGLLFWLL